MKKFKYLITSSLLKKIQSKAFVISMIITSVLILAITILPTLFTNIEEEPEIEEFNVVLIDETDQVNDIRGYLDGILNEISNFNIMLNNDYLEESFWDDSIDLLIIYEISDESNNTLLDVSNVKYYSKLGNTYYNSIIKEIVLNTKYSLLINEEEYKLNLNIIDKPGVTPVDPETPDGNEFNPAVLGFSTIVFTVMFMFIVISTQSMGAEILEEKSTKAIETIISSAPAELHFFSKVISGILFTAIQLGIMLVAGVIGILISNALSGTDVSFIDLISNEFALFDINLGLLLFVTILVIILGLILYLVLFAFFASFANNNEEYQKAITPMMIILLIIFYGSMFLSGSQEIGLIKGLAYVPFFTPFLLPLGVIMKIFSTIEIILYFIVLIIAIFFFTWLLIPAYRVSILNYSGDKLFKEITRSIKQSRANKKNKRQNNK